MDLLTELNFCQDSRIFRDSLSLSLFFFFISVQEVVLFLFLPRLIPQVIRFSKEGTEAPRVSLEISERVAPLLRSDNISLYFTNPELTFYLVCSPSHTQR